MRTPAALIGFAAVGVALSLAPAALDGRTVRLEAGEARWVPIDAKGELTLRLDDGSMPDAWVGRGGALLRAEAPPAATPSEWRIPWSSATPGWLRLEGASPAIVEVRQDRPLEARFADPWRALADQGEGALTRWRADAMDRVVRLGHEAIELDIGDVGALQLVLWRRAAPRQAAPEATSLQLTVDGRPVFDGLVPTPVAADRLYRVGDDEELLETVGELDIQWPAEAKRLRVIGEPGVQLQLRAPLAGARPPRTPSESPTEASPEDPAAFRAALADWPADGAEAYLGRHSIFVPAGILPLGGPLFSQWFRPRFVDAAPRRRLVHSLPVTADPVAPLLFHWLPAGARWRIDAADAEGDGQLRVVVAHPASGAPTGQLQLERAGEPAVRWRLDADLRSVLEAGTSASDALMALTADQPPVVDASQDHVVVRPGDAPLWLSNPGTAGLWIAVEQRTPRPRVLSRAIPGTPALPPEWLRASLSGRPPPHSASLGRTRALASVRDVLAARARAFASRSCALAGMAHPEAAAEAMARWQESRGADAVLARCALEMAFAAAPGDAGVRDAVAAWAQSEGMPAAALEAWAWAVERPELGDDLALWRSMAHALAAEGEDEAASLVALAAELAAPAESGVVSLPPVRSRGLVRLAGASGRQQSMWIADAQGAEWSATAVGRYRLVLRNASEEDQWVRLRSGTRTWWTWLPSARREPGALRGTGEEGPIGIAVDLPFAVTTPGAAVHIEARHRVFARVQGPPPRATPPHAPESHVVRSVRFDGVEAGRVRTLDIALTVLRPAPPPPAGGDEAGGRAELEWDSDAPLVGDGLPPRTALPPTVTALWALRRFEDGDRAGGLDAAAAAFFVTLSGRSLAIPGLASALNAHVHWPVVVPESFAGRQRRAQPLGLPNDPVPARRARWAGVTSEATAVVQPGRRWIVEGLAGGQVVPVVATLRSALPQQVVVDAPEGGRWTLQPAAPDRFRLMADAAGRLRLRLGDALPGAYVELRLLDADGEALESGERRTWYRGPLVVAQPEPTVLFVQRWDGGRLHETVHRTDAQGRFRLGEGAADTGVYRVRALAARPAAPAAPARRVTTLALGTTAGVPETPDASLSIAGLPSAPAVAGAPWRDAETRHTTWGALFALQQRSDPDDDVARRERFAEARWRTRWSDPSLRLWGRLDVVARRHGAGEQVYGAVHDLEWRQQDGPWGATVDVAAWRQVLPDASAWSIRTAVDWRFRRHERFRDQIELGLRWRDPSLRSPTAAEAARLDLDVYSRYRDAHRRQLDLRYRLDWRTAFGSEWFGSVFAVSNARWRDGVDHVGGDFGWRYTRGGWSASAEWQQRHYRVDSDRRRSARRDRLELAASRMVLGVDSGWRLRMAASYERNGAGLSGGVALEWFDHGGHGLDDFAPSELFLRDVLLQDLTMADPDEESPR